MRLFQDDQIDESEVVEIGSGLTLAQNAEGIPLLTGTGGGGAWPDGTETDPGAYFINQPGSGLYLPDPDYSPAFRATVDGTWSMEWGETAITMNDPLHFASTSVAAPTFTTLSAGVRISLFPSSLSGSDVTHSIGVMTNAVWYACGSVANHHKWYGGTTEWMRLYVEGMNNGKLEINPGLSMGAFSSTAPKGLLVKISSNDTGTIFHLGGLVYAEQTVGTVQSIQGLEGYARTTNPSGTVTLSIGTIGNFEHDGAGALTESRGMQSGGVKRSGSGTITSCKSLYVANVTNLGGTITTFYGIWVDTPTAGTTNWAIFVNGGAVYFGGTLQWGGGSTISSSNSVVTTARVIATSTGLTGGGDLSADRTLSIDTSVVPQKAVSETITATNWTFSGMIIATNSPGIEVHVSSGSAFYRLARAGQFRYQFGLDVSDNWVVLAYDSSSSFIQTPLQIANSGSDPVSIRVGGALKNLQIDGSGFIKGV